MVVLLLLLLRPVFLRMAVIMAYIIVLVVAIMGTVVVLVVGTILLPLMVLQQLPLLRSELVSVMAVWMGVFEGDCCHYSFARPM